MAKKEKTFNYKLYALVAFLLVAALLACTTIFAVKQKYIAFDEKKLAVSYADTIFRYDFLCKQQRACSLYSGKG